MHEPARTAISERAKLSRTLSIEVIYGKSIRAFQIFEQVEKVEQVNKEISQEGNDQVEQAEQAENPVRSSIPRSGIGARDDATHDRARSRWQ